MGEVSETATTMTAKKKKGRPSLLDLQIRSLKQQQQQNQNRNQQPQPQNPNSLNFIFNPNSRSSGPKPNLNAASRAQDWISGVGDEDDDDERKEKKHRLLLGFDSNSNSHYPTSSLNSLSFNSVPDGSDSNADGDAPEVAFKRRKTSPANHGSIQTVMIKWFLVLKVIFRSNDFDKQGTKLLFFLLQFRPFSFFFFLKKKSIQI